MKVKFNKDADYNGNSFKAGEIYDGFDASELDAIKEFGSEYVETPAPEPKKNYNKVQITVREAIEDDPQRGYKSFGEFIKDVCLSSKGKLNKEGRERLTKATGANINTGAAGGYGVPTAFSDMLMSSVVQASPILSACNVIAMDSGTLDLPRFKLGSFATSYYGVSYYVTDDAASITTSYPQLDKVQLIAKDHAALIPMSNNLIEDNPSAIASYGNCVQQGLQLHLEDQIVAGAGGNEFVGVSVSPAIQTSSDAYTTNATFLDAASGLIKYMPNLASRGLFYLASPSAYARVVKGFGAAGGAVALYTDPVRNINTVSILGIPVLKVQKLPAVNTAKCLMLCDLSEYIVGIRNGIKSEQSVHVYFATNENALRVIVRCQGAPSWNTSVLASNGSDYITPVAAVTSGS